MLNSIKEFVDCTFNMYICTYQFLNTNSMKPKEIKFTGRERQILHTASRRHAPVEDIRVLRKLEKAGIVELHEDTCKYVTTIRGDRFRLAVVNNVREASLDGFTFKGLRYPDSKRPDLPYVKVEVEGIKFTYRERYYMRNCGGVIKSFSLLKRLAKVGICYLSPITGKQVRRQGAEGQFTYYGVDAVRRKVEMDGFRFSPTYDSEMGYTMVKVEEIK